MLGVALLHEGLGLLLVHPAGRFHVALVTSNHDDDILVVGMFSQLRYPLLHFLKGLIGGDFVDNDGSHSIPVVDWGHSIVHFLSGSVPNG